MRNTICFFHRNPFHNQIYPEMGRYIRDAHGLDIRHIRRLGKIEGEVVFEYEREIEELWDAIDISDSALIQLDNKYPGAELLRLVYADRNCNFFPKYSDQEKIAYKKQLKYLVGCVTVFEKYIGENPPACVISDLSIGIADIFRHVCGKNGIHYLTIRSSKLTPGIIFSDPDYDIPVGLAERWKQFAELGIPDEYLAAARNHIEGIRQKVLAPPYMEISKQRYRILSLDKVISFIKNSKYKAARVTPVSLEMCPVRTSLKWNYHKIKNIWITRLNKSKWFDSELPPGMKYFVFTLQYEPENSTTIRAYPFSNQICVIESLAKALPLGVYLVVKEHRGNQGYRKTRDYRDIWYLPNVKLVSPEYHVNELVRNSLGVITLTSRMGWEALVLGKNVIGLGTTFYSMLDEVKKPQSWADLRELLKQSTKTGSKAGFDISQSRLEAFAAAYISLTRKGKYIFKGAGVNSADNIRLLSEAIIDELKQRNHHNSTI